jgi:hypothetical protein
MRRNGMIDRYDAPMGMVAVRCIEDDIDCTECAVYKYEHIQINCPYRCREYEREDGENVIFKTRADFEAMLQQELEQFYNIKITKPIGEASGLLFFTVENPSQRVRT